MSKQIAIYSSMDVTGTVITDEITIPNDFNIGYVNVLLAAPANELNIFDIEVLIKIFDDETQEWQVIDSTREARTLDDVTRAVTFGSSARIQDLASRKLRGEIRCGQCRLMGSINISY